LAHRRPLAVFRGNSKSLIFSTERLSYNFIMFLLIRESYTRLSTQATIPCIPITNRGKPKTAISISETGADSSMFPRPRGRRFLAGLILNWRTDLDGVGFSVQYYGPVIEIFCMIPSVTELNAHYCLSVVCKQRRYYVQHFKFH
jgi:hypothetical protein